MSITSKRRKMRNATTHVEVAQVVAAQDARVVEAQEAQSAEAQAVALQAQAEQDMLGADAQEDAQEDGAEQDAQDGKKRARKPVLCGANGKPLHGLTVTPAGYTLGGARLVRQQFTSAAAWYAHMVNVQALWGAHYSALAQDALANPAKYAKASSAAIAKEENARLLAKAGKLEQALLAAGYTPEQIAAIV